MRSNDAYAARLRAMAQEQVDDAWTDRLNGFADEQRLRGMSDCATEAWTARLSGLAEYLSADEN